MIDEQRAQREQVCAVARSWIGTPYRDGARVKGSGADCAMLVAAVYEEVGVIPVQPIKSYPPQWHLNRGGQRFIEIVTGYGGREIDAPDLGDLVLYEFGRSFAHGGIIVDPGWPMIVEASKPARFVVLGDGANGIYKTINRKFFTLWGA